MSLLEGRRFTGDPAKLGFSSRNLGRSSLAERPEATIINGNGKPHAPANPGLIRAFRADIITIDQLKAAINYRPEIFDVLPKRELAILTLMAQGWKQSDIAGRLGLSKRTVENHAFRAYGKLPDGITKEEIAIALLIRKEERYEKPAEEANLDAKLTKREKEVTRLLEEGKTNKEIAAALGIRPRTAENHVQHVFNKLALNRRGLRKEKLPVES